MCKLIELAEQCEKASGPDREIDYAICLSLGWTCKKMKGDSRPYYRKPGVTEYYDRSEPPDYTSSLDAAMRLADGLRGLSLNMRSNPDMGGKDWLVSAGSLRSAARSWPLALCAVGLRDKAKSAPVT